MCLRIGDNRVTSSSRTQGSGVGQTSTSAQIAAWSEAASSAFVMVS